MNVAHVLPWISRSAGGALGAISGLAKASQAFEGWRVAVFGSQDIFADEDRQLWHPLAVHTAPVLGPARLCCTPAMQRMVENFGPDIIHSAAVWTWQAAVINKLHTRKEIPFVLSTHGSLDRWALRRSAWKKAIALQLFQQKHFDHAACIHALSESELASIREFGLKNPVCVIPNGIEIPEEGERPIGEGRQSLSSRLGSLAPGRRMLLYLGRIHPKKGLINLIHAWAAICDAEGRNRRFEDWLLVIAGWDEWGHERELRTLTEQRGIQDKIAFPGPQFGREKAEIYRSCDAFVLPSFSEGLPMVVLEAWAYGKPVLMTPQCNLAEGFTAGAAIRIEQGAEGRNMEAGLRELLQASSSDLQAMGAKGRALVAERFTWPKIAGEMRSVYEWVLGGGAAPSCVSYS